VNLKSQLNKSQESNLEQLVNGNLQKLTKSTIRDINKKAFPLEKAFSDA
jgi:hypothetical protein